MLDFCAERIPVTIATPSRDCECKRRAAAAAVLFLSANSAYFLRAASLISETPFMFPRRAADAGSPVFRRRLGQAPALHLLVFERLLQHFLEALADVERVVLLADAEDHLAVADLDHRALHGDVARLIQDAERVEARRRPQPG